MTVRCPLSGRLLTLVAALVVATTAAAADSPVGRIVAQVIPVAFDPAGLALERLEAVAAVENVASRRVLEKNGFRFEGIARGYLIIAGARVDHARYGLLRSDMMPPEHTNP